LGYRKYFITSVIQKNVKAKASSELLDGHEILLFVEDSQLDCGQVLK
jgi:hypothetical protein